jgi:hypothetical protein
MVEARITEVADKIEVGQYARLICLLILTKGALADVVLPFSYAQSYRRLLYTKKSTSSLRTKQRKAEADDAQFNWKCWAKQ